MSTDQPNESTEQKESSDETEQPTCGIVMPISAIDGQPTEHWFEVLSLIKDVAKAENFKSELVSYSDESGIIQQKIINNLYNNEVVICDVSGKNPNVMFELGMRLAFDKATIVIKDDKTDYSFDTSPIEHLEYPRDLRFNKIIGFKKVLGAKLKATYLASKDSNYSTFLKHFGTFDIKGLKEKEGGINEYVVNAIEALRSDVLSLRKHQNQRISKIPLVEDIVIYADNFVDRLADEALVGRSDMFTAEEKPRTTLAFQRYMNSLGYDVSLQQAASAIDNLMPF